MSINSMEPTRPAAADRVRDTLEELAGRLISRPLCGHAYGRFLMELKLGHLRQIALPSGNLSGSVQFYRDTLGVEFIAQYDPPGLAFFRLGRTRLLLEHSADARPSGAVVYFEVPDIEAAYLMLKESGVEFDSAPHLIYRDETGTFGPAGGEEWMAFFKDPDGNVLALASRIAAPAA